MNTAPSESVTPVQAPAILVELANVQRRLGAIGKDNRNRQQGFNFRGVEDVYNAVHPLFAEYGILTLPTVEGLEYHEGVTKKGDPVRFCRVRMRYQFISSTDGSSVAVSVPGEGQDMADKGTAKAMSVAHKYAIFQLFMVPTREVILDGDSETPPPATIEQPEPMPATENQVQQLEQAAAAGAIDKAGVLAHYGVQGFVQLTRAQASKVMEVATKRLYERGLQEAAAQTNGAAA